MMSLYTKFLKTQPNRDKYYIIKVTIVNLFLHIIRILRYISMAMFFAQGDYEVDLVNLEIFKNPIFLCDFFRLTNLFFSYLIQ